MKKPIHFGNYDVLQALLRESWYLGEKLRARCAGSGKYARAATGGVWQESPIG
jgi:hypothetical protein